MDGLQVTVVCLLLKMTFEPSSAGTPLKPSECPTCPEGYYLKAKCIITPEFKGGIRCGLCTDCSETDRVTLVSCSRTADSVCGQKTTTGPPPIPTLTDAPVLDPDMSIVLPVVIVSVLLLILLSVFLTLLSCKYNEEPRDQKQVLNVL